MKTYKIGELYGNAWNTALSNVGNVLGKSQKEIVNSWAYIERVASTLGVRFDINGEIVREA